MSYENITINTQSSIRIALSSAVIYFDPIEKKEQTSDADIIFVTHDHFDHYSPESIAKIKKDSTVLVVPAKLYGKAASECGIAEENIVSVVPGEKYTAGGITFETVGAYNNLKPFHTKSAGWCGYIAEADGIRYYVAGDTDANADNKKTVCDVALVPIGGTYTMDWKAAAEFVNAISPKTVIPTHYGSIVGKPDDGKRFASKVSESIETVIML